MRNDKSNGIKVPCRHLRTISMPYRVLLFWHVGMSRIIQFSKIMSSLSIYQSQKSGEKHAPRKSRHAEFISQFTATIQHVVGDSSVVADALLRILEISVPSEDFTKMTLAQLADEITCLT
ncbi:hypothetical protein NPIL_234841 [Nephila pilipes]|uniref:Uncharacterized protein n=1 Tax=Nephila pilipes TaxID=299642 RepID=A0A8X6UJ78_NEPPI|nr:hypothetical protein NPIL_234841 [Nephila pilipes]